MCCIVVLCAAAFLKRIVNGTSAKQTVCKWQIFLLKDVAHWSSWSFHWLLWKKFHLLCSTLKRWKEGSEFKLIKKTRKAYFLRRGSFFLSRYVFFLNSCSLEMQSLKSSSLSLCVSSCPQQQLNSLEDLQNFARNNGVPQGIWVP